MFKPCLPTELLLPILQFIHPSDFDYSLCLVSRTFRANAEIQFYKYVSVPEKRLLYFCRTMFARPDLARRVQRLAFTGAVHREPEPGDTDVVAGMMKLLVNLKDLCISSSIYIPETRGGASGGAGAGEWPVNRDDVRILYDCPFKLERLDCMFTWGEPLARWLATQPQLVAFEHDGYPRGEVRLGSGGSLDGEGGGEGGSGGDGEDDDGAAAATTLMMRCSYLRITPYILECFEGRVPEAKPQPVALRFDMRFITVQQEFNAARSLGDICRNLKCLTLTRQISTTGEYLSTSRILRSFAEKAPKLTCLAIYENIDYVSFEFCCCCTRSFARSFMIECVSSRAAVTVYIVRGGEQTHTAHHQGALFKAASLRLGAAQLSREPRRRRLLVDVLLLGLLDRLVHRRGGILVR